LEANSGIVDAGCEAKERIITLGRIPPWITAVRHWNNRLHFWRKSKTGN
jgi:hypothetical protein